MKMAMLLMVAACGMADGNPKSEVGGRKSEVDSSAPLVLELFTSQGCSSCPPADRLLSELAVKSGRPVVPLSFHVDYWNGLGWVDPLSSEQWTNRQKGYAAALQDRVYTPELVIGGMVGLVGSWRDRIAATIAQAPKVDPLAATATWRADAVEVTATAPAGAAVFVAVWEGTISTVVPRGENAGETLVSDRVVRRFERVAAAGQRGTIRVPIEPTWRGVGAVAFAQPEGGGRIVASALLPVAR